MHEARNNVIEYLGWIIAAKTYVDLFTVILMYEIVAHLIEYRSHAI